MKLLLSILYITWYFCLIVQAADRGSTNDAVNPNLESDSSAVDEVAASETADTADTNDPFRIKRQHGHASPFSGILSSVFNKKLGLIGSLSSISSSSSGSSKGVETHHHTYEYSHPPPPKPFDWWSLKKTVLASLLQAVKAITGGVIALNGQLVKVKGHLLAAKGHLLSTKGDSITNFGRHLATHAFGTGHEVAHTDVHEASIPSAPSGSIPSGFGASGPSGVHSSLESGFPSHHFKAAGEEYPAGYYKDGNGYAKRAAPLYYIVENDTSDKSQK